MIRSPVIVQIHAVTDIGVSAFALSRTLDERRDVLSGATRIRRMDEEEDEVEEGKLPPYVRSMLSLEVSDGRTAMRAIEYRRVEGLVLAETPLGTKVSLRDGGEKRGEGKDKDKSLTAVAATQRQVPQGNPYVSWR